MRVRKLIAAGAALGSLAVGCSSGPPTTTPHTATPDTPVGTTTPTTPPPNSNHQTGQPIQVSAYVDLLNQVQTAHGQPPKTPTQALTLAAAICNAMDKGLSTAGASAVFLKSGHTPAESDQLVTKAIGAACTEHAPH